MFLKDWQGSRPVLFKVFFIETFSHLFLPRTSIDAIGAPIASMDVLGKNRWEKVSIKKTLNKTGLDPCQSFKNNFSRDLFS